MSKYKIINGELCKLMFSKYVDTPHGRIRARRRKALCFWLPVRKLR